MHQRILILQGHPDRSEAHLCHALADHYRAHSLKSLERNILGFVGLSPIRETLIGGVEGMSQKEVDDWFREMHTFGAEGR